MKLLNLFFILPFLAVSTETVLGDAAELTSLSKLEEHNRVTDEIVEETVGMSPVPILDSVIMDKKEGPETRTSIEPCASVAERECKSHVSNMLIPVFDSEQHSVCNSAAELQPVMGAAQSSVSVDNSVHSLSQNEPQMMNEKRDQELKGHLTAHVPRMKELSGCEVLEVSSKKYEVTTLHITGIYKNWDYMRCLGLHI